MDSNPKSQVVERLRDAQNVLITVSNDPSVDQLSAAIGFTLLMNKLGKHATAVFSGKIPSTIEFLQPEATIEQNTDSLRDFIIALDKSKADKLRYKVEENVVKIFITPYRTSLSQADFDFSQGDFNVDVVVALGVDQQEHIDQAITAHGRILHDATVIGVMAGPNGVDLGNINWQDPAAGSLCEMLVSISEAFQSGLLDSQMATAFLTGIVAETDRFSNEKTSSKVMTMAAQLMAAGANQQLIATKLAPPPEPVIAESVDLTPAIEPEKPPAAEEGEIQLHDNASVELPEALPKNDRQISIDEQGELHHHDEENQKPVVHNIKADELEGDTVQAADQDDEQPSYSQYITGPPRDDGVLTANAQPEALESSVDPFNDIPRADDTVVPPPGTIRSAQDLQLPPQPDINADQPLGPAVLPSETINTIETKVKQFEGHTADNQAMPNPDAARQAVDDAVKTAGENPDRPEPIQALNAQPFPEINHSEAPPPIAPPLDFSQFPVPSETAADQFEQPDQNQTNGTDSVPPLPA